MPDLPPIGSLWLHRESGERRFVMRAEVSEFSGNPRPILIAVLRKRGEQFTTTVVLDNWLAWQAEADRIDREDA